MKNIQLLAIFLLLAFTTKAQFAYIEPSVPNLDDTVTLYVNLQLDADCSSLVGTTDPLYIWSWMPVEPVGGNGDWTASNLDNEMTNEGNDVWSFKMVPTEFYGVAAQEFYDKGISFLVKALDGGSGGDCGTSGGEFKTSDIELEIEAPFVPKPKVFSFPKTRKIGNLSDELHLVSRKDDFFTLIYNNNKEDKPSLDGVTEFWVYARVYGSDGNFYTYQPFTQVGNYPELKMTTNGDGFYRHTIVPEEFFADILPQGVTVAGMRYQIVRVPVATTDDTVDGIYDFNFTCP